MKKINATKEGITPELVVTPRKLRILGVPANSGG
jgi:hypothetical protein